ncbi:MAG: hypothetical protein WDZ49_00455, partial [Litorilinea sp.]
MNLRDFYGPNAGYIWSLYERFLADPQSVDASVRTFFAELDPAELEQNGRGGLQTAPPSVPSSVP